MPIILNFPVALQLNNIIISALLDSAIVIGSGGLVTIVTARLRGPVSISDGFSTPI